MYPFRRLSGFILFVTFSLGILCFVQSKSNGIIQLCHKASPPAHLSNQANCSLECNVHLQNIVSGYENEELHLCIRNSTVAVTCNNLNDCHKYHIGAYCKKIPCFCKSEFSIVGSYVLHPSIPVPKLSACVVSSKRLLPDMPIVPFPWKTLAIVCGIVFSFAVIMFCLRWVSPYIQSFQFKHATRSAQDIDHPSDDEQDNLFPCASRQAASVSVNIISQDVSRHHPTIQQSSRIPSRGGYTSCRQADSRNNSQNQDRPPPYETAVQLPPPTYEELHLVTGNTSPDIPHDERKASPSNPTSSSF